MPREQEHYCAKLVSDALGGAAYKRNYHFQYLRGDPTDKNPKGAMLPVDAYYPDFDLVLEFREKQHYGDRVKLWDARITATGDTRKVQRRRYDERREEVLPAHGIKLLIVYDYEITGTYNTDLRLIKRKLRDITNLACATEYSANSDYD